MSIDQDEIFKTLKRIRAVLRERGTGEHRMIEFDMAVSEVLGRDFVYVMLETKELPRVTPSLVKRVRGKRS
jgi:hypothetical protein